MNPLQRARLATELRDLSAKLAAGELAPMAKVAASARSLELIRLLGGQAAAPAEPEAEIQAPAGEQPMESEPEEEGAPDESQLSDDPNSPNYRFRDTGYIPGSRKELAKAIIKRAKDSGQQVLATDLDWAALETNPREAAQLIVKSNLFGQVDWDALKENGMEPGAGFLIDRIYASIAPKPEDNSQARHDYALALQTIRERLESCVSVDEVRQVLEEIRGELTGVVFNAEEAAQYAALEAQHAEVKARYLALYHEREALTKAWERARAEVGPYQWEQSKRQRRGWKPDPELEANIARLEPAAEAARLALVAWDEAHPEFTEKWTTTRTETGIETNLTGGIRAQLGELTRAMQGVEQLSQARNIVENPLTRGWLSFGPKFLAVVNYRYERSGSKAFRDHYTSAKNGKVKDWEWAEKEVTKAPRSTKQQINFRLKVADTFKRVGGTPVKVDSTVALKQLVGFRDVQLGKWVAEDPASAAFHVQSTAEAMLDLSDVLGIAPEALGLGGRLGMGFGARGRGNAGWGGAAQAHYEPVHRVINLTKMGGGGALGHELFHAVDNMLGELMGGEPGTKEGFATINPELLPEGAVRDAMRALRSEMLTGDRRLPELIKLKPRDKALAQHNIDGYSTTPLPRLIRAAGGLEAAILAVDGYFKDRAPGKRTEKNRKDWRRLAAAYYSPAGTEEVRAETGPAVSNFMAEAVILDNGVHGKYWSTPDEMGARAFQSYLEDKLSAAGRRNDYLSCFADNKYHFDALLGVQWRPYPEGEERQRLNAAFDRFFAAIREDRVFEKAAGNKALLDSIFGVFDDE